MTVLAWRVNMAEPVKMASTHLPAAVHPVLVEHTAKVSKHLLKLKNNTYTDMHTPAFSQTATFELFEIICLIDFSVQYVH